MSKLIEVSNEKILRGLVLEICDQAGLTGAGMELIQAALKASGFYAAREDILNACKYLEGKELIKLQQINNTRLKIFRNIAHLTPKGKDALDGTIVIEGIELAGD